MEAETSQHLHLQAEVSKANGEIQSEESGRLGNGSLVPFQKFKAENQESKGQEKMDI